MPEHSGSVYGVARLGAFFVAVHHAAVGELIELLGLHHNRRAHANRHSFGRVPVTHLLLRLDGVRIGVCLIAPGLLHLIAYRKVALNRPLIPKDPTTGRIRPILLKYCQIVVTKESHLLGPKRER